MWVANAGTLRNVTPVTLPSRQAALTRMSPAGDSSVSSVTGSVIGRRPVSSSTVTTHIVLVPDMPGILDLLHDHVAGVGVGMARRQDQVAVRGRVAARLAQHPQAEVVAVRLEPRHLVEHRRAGDVLDPAHDHPARLPGGMGVDGLDDGADPQPVRERHGHDATGRAGRRRARARRRGGHPGRRCRAGGRGAACRAPGRARPWPGPSG